jgi:uncharacterized phage protein (TIGR01671 family)
MNKRIFKFRGKDVFTDTWKYGDLVHNQKVTTVGLEPRTMVGGYEVKEETVSQYTEVNDCDNKEIYENDILKYVGDKSIKEHYKVVVYYKGSYFLRNIKTYRDTLLLDFYVNEKLSKWKIIGNIFDNNLEGKGKNETN